MKTHFATNAQKATRYRFFFYKMRKLKRKNHNLKLKIKKFRKNKTNLKNCINKFQKKLKKAYFEIDKMIYIRQLFDLNDY